MSKTKVRAGMADADKHELFRIILARLNSGRISGKRKHLESDILSAHLGRPDGWWVTTDNLHLFRQYRNDVSCEPKHMVDAALAWKEDE
jgi:hypothetical protein